MDKLKSNCSDKMIKKRRRRSRYLSRTQLGKISEKLAMQVMPANLINSNGILNVTTSTLISTFSQHVHFIIRKAFLSEQ